MAGGGDNIGRIDLQLGINKSDFTKQINNIGPSTQKALGPVGVAIGNMVSGLVMKAVAGLGNFVSECVSLGSELQEIQNVVDTVFPSMSAEVDKFSKTAISNFGLSEAVAKKYVSTLGAMAKASGYSEKEAFGMSTAITGLVGDVSSFYNLDSEEAYNKLKAVFTGETEGLRSLGVVMTQTSLDEFAMASGMGKTTANMTEQEKVALRLAFVQEKLSAATGDFIKTGDGWANQTRVLSLRFDSLKASIGQGLISALLPVVQMLNTLMASLQSTADAFANFMASVFGAKKSTSSASASATGDLAAIEAGADKAAGAVSGVGSAAKAASKFLAGFDTITKISSGKSGGSGGGSGGLAAYTPGGTTESSGAAEDAQKTSSALDMIKAKFVDIKALFAGGFATGFGDNTFKPMLDGIAKVKDGLINIFTSPEVIYAGANYVDVMATNMGKAAGTATSIGTTIGNAIFGGLGIWFDNNADTAKSWIVKMFDIKGDFETIRQNLLVAVADIFSVFGNEDTQGIVADLLQMFTDGFFNVTELAGEFGNDVYEALSQPIIDNKDGLKKNLEETIKPLKGVLDDVTKGWNDTWSKVQTTYDTKLKPFIDSVRTGLSSLVATFSSVYSQYIAPVLAKFGTQFSALYNEHLKPMIDKLVVFIGELAEGLNTFWVTTGQPFVTWIIEEVVPKLMPLISSIGEAVFGVIGGIADVIGGLIDTLTGLIDFLEGVFTGDWGKAWDGLRLMLKGNMESVVGLFSTAWNAIKLVFAPIIFYFQNIWENIKNTFSSVGSWFGDMFSLAWENIKAMFSNPGAYFSEKWEQIKGVFSSVDSFFGDKFGQAWENIKSKFSSVGEFFGGIWDTVSKKFTDLGGSVGSAIGDAFKNTINGVLGTVESILNKAIGIINTAIVAYNNVMPGTSLDMAKLSTISIPRLASGAIISAPTLAMIGEAGKEAVVPLENNLGWLDKLATMVAGKLKASEVGGDIYITMPIQFGNEVIDVIIRKIEGKKRVANA